MEIFESIKVYEYLKKRNILLQYKKAKELLLLRELKRIDFRLRKPKKDKIYYFKINKQYRALGKFVDNNFLVIEINNHQ